MHPHQRPSTSAVDTRFARVTKWLARLAAALSAVLLILVVVAIHSGLEVQQSTRVIDENLRETTRYFDERADMDSPARARTQLSELRAVLVDLNSAAAADVDQLARMLPDVRTVVTASQEDAAIADRLRGIATSLQGAAGSLKSISDEASVVVATVDERLIAALELVDQLNAELRRTTTKLAPIPAQGNVIPAPTGVK